MTTREETLLSLTEVQRKQREIPEKTELFSKKPLQFPK